MAENDYFDEAIDASAKRFGFKLKRSKYWPYVFLWKAEMSL